MARAWCAGHRPLFLASFRPCLGRARPRLPGWRGSRPARPGPSPYPMRTLLQNMTRRRVLVIGDILLADRGFCNWGPIAQCQQRGIHVVFRVLAGRYGSGQTRPS